MLKGFLTVTENEKLKMEEWIRQNYNQDQNVPVDILLLILYKIHLLEQKIDTIEKRTERI